ncbi:MAG: CoA pyrophosphatase [Flavobacteriaceae bacterium]
MDFSLFREQIPKIEKTPLPGAEAQLKMVPAGREHTLYPPENELEKVKRAGVLALFYPDGAGKVNVLFILRRTYEGVHSNQVAFPGGKMEREDRDLRETALRETYEEVGVASEDIHIIRPVSPVYIAPSNFLVQPYMGLCDYLPKFRKQESEVADLIQVPLQAVMDDSNIFEERVQTSYAITFQVPAFKLNGHVVWGATAMMLSEIRTLIRPIVQGFL